MRPFNAAELLDNTDDATDDLQAAANYFGDVELGAGTYTLQATLRPTTSNRMRIAGSGADRTILLAAHSGYTLEALGSAGTLVLEDLTLDGADVASTVLRVLGGYVDTLICRRVRFKGAASMLRVIGCRTVLLDDCDIYGPNSVPATAVSAHLSFDDCQRVTLRDCRAYGATGVINFGDNSEAIAEGVFTLDDCDFRGEWYAVNANFTDTVLVSSASSVEVASSTTISVANDHMRFYETTTATITGSSYANLGVTATAASFPSAHPGDLAVTSDGYCGFITANTATTISVEEWLDPVTMWPKPGRPAVGQTVELRQVRIGRVDAESSGTYTIYRWMDLDGATVSPPAPGTAVDFIRGGTFGVQVSASVGLTKVLGSEFRRFRGDQCAVQCGRTIAVGNYFEMGSDGGLTVWGRNNTVVANSFRKQRGANIFLADVTHSTITGNTLWQPNVEKLSGNVGAINTGGECAHNTIASNTIDGGEHPGSRYGIAIRGTSHSNLIEANTIVGMVEAPVYMDDTSGGASIIRGGRLESGNSGVIHYHAAHAGPGDEVHISGPGSPEGAIKAVIGSTYTRTDGGTGTTFYVKESGAGDTGWVAK